MKTVKNILIAPDKFKFTLSAKDVVSAVYNGLLSYKNINIYKLPLADGGEGTSDILSDYFSAKRINISVNNPLFKKIDTYYYFSEENKTAIIDLASASGLHLLKKEQQNPMQTSSYGTGEMILDAMKIGAKKIILGLGGSATNDLGIGAANALGYKFLDNKGEGLPPIGANLINISAINDANVNPLLKDVQITVLYDVDNVLFGKNGAAYIYAEQKGASKEEIEILDAGLKHISKLVKAKFKKDLAIINGGGAAGGFGTGALSFFNAELKSGSRTIFEITELDSYLRNCDLIITGEGKFDKQSLNGKVVGELIKKAEEYKIPIVVMCGQAEIDADFVKSKYLHSIITLFDEVIDMDTAKQKSYDLIVQKVKNEIARDFLY